MDIIRYMFHGLCHQIPGRALSAGGTTMPCCARCAGLYVGICAGLAVFLVRGRKRRDMPGRGFAAAAVGALVLFAADAAAGFLGIWSANAAVRFSLGMQAGLFAAPFIVLFFYGTFRHERGGGALAGCSSAAVIVMACAAGYLLNRRPSEPLIIIESVAAGAGLVALLAVAHFSILRTILGGSRMPLAVALAAGTVPGQIVLLSLLRSLLAALDASRLAAFV